MAAATLLIAVNATAAQLPSPSSAAPSAPNPGVTPSQAPVPGMGQGRGARGQRSADARFIVMMIPHHQGAIAMAELAVVRGGHPELRALAKRIATSQRQENAQMRRWYREWYGTDPPEWSCAGTGMGPGMGMGMGMGWGAAQDLKALRTAGEFDRAFLKEMVAHHRMGVWMASQALHTSQRPELRALEQGMVRVQSEEIRLMEQWLREWFKQKPPAGAGGDGISLPPAP